MIALFYILSDNNNLYILNYEDNIGNEVLKNSMSWNKYKSQTSKSTLTHYIGKFEVDDGNLKVINSNVKVKNYKLLEKDLLIACSDGLTDYISSISRSDDIWMTDGMLRNIFINNKGMINLL